MNETFAAGSRSPSLGFLLRAPYERLQARLYGALEEGGYPEIRPSHSAVFRHLDPAGSRLTDLAAKAGLAKQSMAYLVGHLERQGYVSTRPDPSDARARLVAPTGRGRELVEALLAASREQEERLAGELGRERLLRLREDLAEVGRLMASWD